jgi:FecR protein
MSDRLEDVTSLAREAAGAPVGAELHAEGRRRLLGAMHAPRRRTPAGAARRFAPAALAATVVTLLGFAFFVRTAPLRYEVRGGSISAASYVSAPPSGPAEVRFSDGSNVVAAAGSRLRVEETRADGARVLLERGTATARVQHERRSGWLFVAGPFDVHVTGTRLTIAWDPTKEEVDVTLHEGSVEIDSPVGPSHYVVGAGHRFHASVLEGTVKMDGAPASSAAPAERAGSTEPAPSAPLAIASTAAPESRSAAPSTPSAAVREESWPDLVRRGAFEAVVAAAKDRGLSGCLATCTAPDVRALADAARYVGDTETAKRSLTSLRSRFSGSRQGAAAAFLLGRTSESTGDLQAADHWYRTYLDDAPNGEFAADALAGRMRTSAALEGARAGALLAREYLRRYPDGVHAPAARKLAGPD